MLFKPDSIEMDKSLSFIKLKPTHLHVCLNGDITVHFHVPLQIPQAQAFKIAVPGDKLTQAFNTLHVSIDGRHSKSPPRVLFPSPYNDSNVKSMHWLKSQIGATVELDDDGDPKRGVLRHVSYETSLQMINIVLQDPLNPEIVSAHLIEPNYEEKLRFITHTDGSSVPGNCPYSTADVLIYVDEIDGVNDMRFGSIRASYCIKTSSGKNGFDIRYHLKISGTSRMKVDEIRHGIVQCFALLSNPLPECLQNVGISFSVSPIEYTDRFPPVSTAHDYKKNQMKQHEPENQTESTNVDSKETKEYENSEESENYSKAEVFDILDIIRGHSIQDNNVEMGAFRSIRYEYKIFRIDGQVYLPCSRSTKIHLSDLNVEAKLNHLVAFRKGENFGCRSAQIVMRLRSQHNHVFIPGIITLQEPANSFKYITAQIGRSGTIYGIHDDLAIEPSIYFELWNSGDRVSKYNVDEETHSLHISVLGGKGFINKTSDNTRILRLMNRGCSSVDVSVVIERYFNASYISFEAIQYRNIEDAALSYTVRSNELRGIRLKLHIEEFDRASMSSIVSCQVQPFDECIIIMKQKIWVERVDRMLNYNPYRNEELSPWNNISDHFINQLHQFGQVRINLDNALNDWNAIQDRVKALKLAREAEVKDDKLDLSLINRSDDDNGNYKDDKYLTLRRNTSALIERALEEQRNRDKMLVDLLMEKVRLYGSLTNVSNKTINSKSTDMTAHIKLITNFGELSFEQSVDNDCKRIENEYIKRNCSSS